MRNPLTQTMTCWRRWSELKSTGFFSAADARLQIDRVLLPARFAYQEAGKRLREQAQIKRIDDRTTRIDLPQHGLHFYWQGPVDNNLYFMIEQEFNEQNPHCYTTDPIKLSPQSTVLDVGACEGLFAYRVLKQQLAQQVLCFEPLPSMAKLIAKGGEEIGLGTALKVEALAVSNLSGPVRLVASDNPDACRIEPCPPENPNADATAICLDEYLSKNAIQLSPQDLIKVDAEGTDFAVIEGARETIRQGHPQIAVTTYHDDSHVESISQLLKELNPDYRFRLKGFSHWTVRPRPVLLQASSL